MIQELARYNAEFDVPPSKIFGVSDPEGLYLHCEVVVTQEYNNKGVSIGAIKQELTVINYSCPEVNYENELGEEVKLKLKELTKMYECNYRTNEINLDIQQVYINLNSKVIEFHFGSI